VQPAPEPGLTVFAGAHLRAILFDPGRARLAVSFDHLERGRHGFAGAAPSRGGVLRSLSCNLPRMTGI
jgi:hypothetical protein